jgi:hypothetical protein
VDSALFRVLEGLGLRPLESVASLDERHALVCARHGQTSPYCVALVEGTRILRTFPEVGPCELVLCPSRALLGGTDLLFGNALCERRFVGLLSLKSGDLHTDVFDEHLEPDFNGCGINGLDVDASGRYGLIAWQWDDFPEFLIVDAEGAEMFRLDATDLIDAAIENVRWGADTSEILCLNRITEEWVRLPVDLAQRQILWQPQAVPVPPDVAREEKARADEASAESDASAGEPLSPEQATAIRAAGRLTIDKLPPKIVGGYKRKGYSDEQIRTLAGMVALSEAFKILGGGDATRFHRLCLSSSWKPLLIAVVLFCVPFLLHWRGWGIAANIACLLAGLMFLVRAGRVRFAKRVLAELMKGTREELRPDEGPPADESNQLGSLK